MRRVLTVAGALLLALVAVLAFNTWRMTQAAAPARPTPPPLPVDAAAIGRLAEAVRYPTISREDRRVDVPAFEGLRAHLERSYPRVHAALRREIVAGHSLMFTWQGTDPALPPIVLASHMDVVPVEPGTEGQWTHPAFAGAVADGFVWGRGTLDDKMGVLGILEAVEAKLAAGWTPKRTVILAFGHDEEVAGTGARAMAALLARRGLRPAMVLDEGLSVVRGVLPVERPVALIGTAEKGYVSLELVATAPGGHSSMPPADSAILKLSRALVRLEEKPFPPRMMAPMAQTLERIGPELPLGMRVAVANRWLTDPLLARSLVDAPASAASVRTSTAVTIVDAGTKQNVLPQSARAVVNHRILPGDTVAGVVAHVKAAIDDPSIRVSIIPEAREPTRVSPIDGPAFAAIERSLARTFPEAMVAPSLTLGGTDARYYSGVTDAIYRFAPISFEPEDLPRVHGTNERVRIADYMRAIGFYGTMLEEAAGR